MGATELDPELVPIEELAPARLVVDEGVLPLFASEPLDGPPRSGASDAVIVVHGALRNAGDYFRAVQAAAGKSGNPLVIAPQFLIDADVSGRADRAGLLCWGTNDWIGGLWKGGWGPVSSYSVMDQLLAAVCRIPGIRRVTMVGNSAGGQLVNRYAAVGRGPDDAGVPVRFVVSNPSSYLYFDRLRPVDGGYAVHQDPEVDRWLYGFGKGVPEYVRLAPEPSFEQYITREVTYLLGEHDNNTDALLLDLDPGARAQGRARRERGELYHSYLRHKAGKSVHRLVVVPGVGHDASLVFGSPEGRACLFG